MLTITLSQLKKLPEEMRKTMTSRLMKILRRDHSGLVADKEDAALQSFIANTIRLAEEHALYSENATLRLITLMLHHGISLPLDGHHSVILRNPGAEETARVDEFQKALEEPSALLVRVTLDTDIESLRRPR